MTQIAPAPRFHLIDIASEDLSGETTDIELLHSISVELIGEKDEQALYSKILDAAIAIMKSQFASMQTLDVSRGPVGGLGELHLLSARGYPDEAIRRFEWVRPDMNTSCGASLRSGRRTIIPDVQKSAELAGSDVLDTFLQIGIHSMQTTPLLSRAGQMLGMITTHWNKPHQPSERDLRLMDILARQAADLLERTKAEAALQARERQLDGILGAVTDAFKSVDSEYRLTFVNERCAARAGRSPAELIGAKIWDVFPNAADDVTRRELGKAIRERVVCEYEVYYEPWGRWFSEKAYPTADGGLAVYSQDVTDRKQAEELRQMLTGELSHRVKNMLATVQAIATQTLRRSSSSAEFVKSFGGRIQSMSLVHSQLSSNDWKGAQLRDIVRDQILKGPADETRVSATGPDVSLDVRIVPQVAMMLHELGTNSIKYGALSRPAGTIELTWSFVQDRLHLLWKETGGPVVQAPVKRGLGTTLIEQSAKGAGGQASMIIEATGVTWDIELHVPQVATPKLVAPTVEPQQSIYLATDLRERKHLGGKRLLVVEDETLVAMEIVDLLEDAGATIVAATGNAAVALRHIETSQIDAALLDANLFGNSVDEIAAALTRKGVPFAYVTGYGRESLPEAFRTAAILPKPFTPQQLVEGASALVSERGDVVNFALEKRRQ